jgi:hypothetical protein
LKISNIKKSPDNLKFRTLPVITADSDSKTTLKFGHSAIRKYVSLAMGLFRKGTRNILLIASRPPPCTTTGMFWFGQKISFLIFDI